MADDEAAPDMAFLEYLGSWEGSDEDWVVLSELPAEQAAAENEEAEPVVQEEDSVETEDES